IISLILRMDSLLFLAMDFSFLVDGVNHLCSRRLKEKSCGQIELYPAPLLNSAIPITYSANHQKVIEKERNRRSVSGGISDRLSAELVIDLFRNQ
ncbi:MAG TPA: hypothetical protein PLY40_05355, partial [Bacillota bacterium]|nr:hypothetical protein [Bacillota bacterium]